MTNRRERRLQNKLNNKKPAGAVSARTDPGIIARLKDGAIAQSQGRVDYAEGIYQQILKEAPDNPDALHLLGLVAHQKDDFDTAITLIRKAIFVSDEPVFHRNLANALEKAKRVEESIVELQTYLEHDPADADVLNSLGNALRTMGHIEPAKEAYKLALEQEPANSGFLNNMGLALFYNGEYDKAEHFLSKALRIDPDNIQALNNMGLLQRNLNHLDKARELLEHALEIDPSFSEAEANLMEFLGTEDLEAVEATLLRTLEGTPNSVPVLKALALNTRNQGKYVESLDYLTKAMDLTPTDITLLSQFARSLIYLDEYENAIEFLESALSLDPMDVESLMSLGAVYFKELRYEEAIEVYSKVLELRPAFPEAWANKASCMLYLQQSEGAIEHLRRAIELAPGYMDGYWNLALGLLLRGELAEGWQKYSRRYEASSFPSKLRGFPQPLWDGSPLQGKSILTYGEQGIGDEFLFGSVLPEIMGQGANIAIECDPRLVTLFQRSFPETKVYPREYQPAESGEEHYDFQIPFPDLCMYYRNRIEDFPDENIFLTPDPDKVAMWKDRLNKLGDRPKIGISWRSLHITKVRQPYYALIEDLEPILTMPGVDFINLQYGDCAQDLTEARERFGVEIHDWDDIDLKDDQDSLAALIENLDFIVGPSSSPAYLSAALGKRTLLFLPIHTAWSMLGQKGKLPWYPSSKLFMKDNPQDEWTKPFEQIVQYIQKNI